jgi:hypothetical protein
MFRFLFLSDLFRHPVQLPARAFDRALRLLLLRDVHLGNGFGESPTRTTQDGQRHLQIALHLFDRRGLLDRRLPLRFQKQFRFRENTLANHTRAFAPRGVKLRGLTDIATVLHEGGAHALAVVRADSRDGHQTLHRHLCGEVSFAYVFLSGFGQ